MQIIYPGDLVTTLFHMWLMLLMLFIPVMVPLFLVMHLLMPKRVLQKYWKSPYFQDWEIAAFSYFPGIMMRTVMLTGVMAFPSLGKKRKITQIYADAPNWYRIYAKTYTIAFFALFGVFIIGLLGFLAYIKISGRA